MRRERAMNRTREKVDAGVQSLRQDGMGKGTEAERLVRRWGR